MRRAGSHFSSKEKELLVELDKPTTRLHWAVSLKLVWPAGLPGVLGVRQRQHQRRWQAAASAPRARGWAGLQAVNHTWAGGPGEPWWRVVLS